MAGSTPEPDHHGQWVLSRVLSGGIMTGCILLVITLARYIILAQTPLDLDVEEAQYWLWSQSPDAGYFSKPPMIAWVIGLGTGIFGNTVFGVKAAAPLIQLISALLIGRVARDMAGVMAGRLAMMFWITLPASAIAGFIMSTDSPMLMFLLAMLVVIAPLARGEAITPGRAFLAGIFAGLAMMSKYAALYLPAGVVLWWLWQGRHCMRLSPRHLVLFVIGTVISMTPNLIWNLNHGFVTVAHLEHNANLEGGTLSLMRSLGFLAAQAGIVGPVMLVLVVMAIAASWRLVSARFWIALALPAISVISVQAFFSNANANWAVASWIPLVILTSTVLAQRWHGWFRIMGIAALSTNVALMLVLMMASLAGSLGPLTPASDPLRRLRGWPVHSQDLSAFAEKHNAGAVITDRRRDAAKFHWGLRGTGISVELIDADGIPANHYEQRHPWQPVAGRRVVLVVGGEAPVSRPGLTLTGEVMPSSLRISRNRSRDFSFVLALEE